MNPDRHKSKRKRHPKDFYETPPELARAALLYALDYWERTDWSYLDDDPILHFLDAGAGNGVWGAELYKLMPGWYLTGVEIEQRPLAQKHYYNEWHKKDFLTFEHAWPVHCVYGNPPFSLGEKFVRHAYDMLEPGGYIYFLLRQGFVGSKTRQFGLYKDCTLKHFVAITRRPSWFTTVEGRKTTDMIDYAMFMFQKGWRGDWTGDWLYWEYEKPIGPVLSLDVSGWQAA